MQSILKNGVFFSQNAAALLTLLSIITFMVIVYSISYIDQIDSCGSEENLKIPFISEGLLRAPYAKEFIVLVFLAFIFVLRTRCDVVAEFITWIWLFSFFNQKNDAVHKMYVIVAGGLTYMLIMMTEAKNLGRYSSLVKSLLSLSAFFLLVVILTTGEETRNNLFITEYVFLILVSVSMILRVLYTKQCVPI